MRFEDKVALITGSGRGIGRTLALRFAAEGADIVINYFRNRQPAEETAADIAALGRRTHIVKANVGDLDSLANLFDEAESAFGGIDIFVHNAASGYNRPALEQKPKGWEWTLNINARALLFGAQHAARLMKPRGGGAIVAISSRGAQRVMPDYILVGASKAALEAEIRYLGVELAPLGIVVNGVSPGVVETDALRHFAVFSEDSVGAVQIVRERTPVGRLATPDDVADLVLFLASPAARMIVGQTIVVDGGEGLLWP